MLNFRRWAGVCVLAAIAVGLTGCEEDDAVFSPLDDRTPPTVNIEMAAQSGDQVNVSVRAADFITVSQVVTELRDPNQPTQEITADGDTILIGRLLAVDTTRFSSRNPEVQVNASLPTFALNQEAIVEVRAVARDAAGNEGVDVANVIAGGGPGGPTGGPSVSITSPQPNQTVRDGTQIRVGVQASDPEAGLAQISATLSDAVSASETVEYSEFRTDVDTLLDFFIPDGAAGPVTITAEAINRNSVSAFAQIEITVAERVEGDTIAPLVAMTVSGGRVARANEPGRLEVDDSLVIDIVAEDRETAVRRVGATALITNVRPGGTETATVAFDTTFDTPVSGTVPVRFGLVPGDLPANVFALDELPDTLFIEMTGWAIDDADPETNCGATVDTTGVQNRLDCTSSEPFFAAGAAGAEVRRMIVAGQTIGFPQGSIIADAAVDEARQLLLLSDFQFGAVRVFDLQSETFAATVPVGSQPWGIFMHNNGNDLLVGNSGGTNISIVNLDQLEEIGRFQTQDLKVYRVQEEQTDEGIIFTTTFFDYSDRPQFIAQASDASGGEILFSTRPALENQQPGTIREYDPVQEEIRFFIDYADREASSNPEIQIVNADSVASLGGGTSFEICDHERGVAPPAGRDCVVVSALEDAAPAVAAMPGWDVSVFTDLVIESIGLQDTTFVAASGDREFIAFGEGDTPARAGRIIMYNASTGTISNALMVTDLTGNAAQQVFGLSLNQDGSLGVGRGEVAFYFGPDGSDPCGTNVLRLHGTNDDINPSGVGAAMHPSHDCNSFNDEDTRLSFLGSGDSRVEIVDTRFFDFKRGDLLIRDPIVGPMLVTPPLAGDPADVVLKLYGVTSEGVVVVDVRASDIDPL